jgi:hypothetical protein
MKMLMNVFVVMTVAAMLAGCGSGKAGKRTDPGQNLPVKVSVVKEKVSLPNQVTAKAVELECQENKNLLLIVAKDGAEQLSMSRELTIGGQAVRFNPAKENNRLVLFIKGNTGDDAATHLLGFDNYSEARNKCEKDGALSSQELIQLLVK